METAAWFLSFLRVGGAGGGLSFFYFSEVNFRY